MIHIFLVVVYVVGIWLKLRLIQSDLQCVRRHEFIVFLKGNNRIRVDANQKKQVHRKNDDHDNEDH